MRVGICSAQAAQIKRPVLPEVSIWAMLSAHNAQPMYLLTDAPPSNFLEAILALLRWLARVMEWLSF